LTGRAAPFGEQHTDSCRSSALFLRIAPTPQPKRIKDLSNTEIAAHTNALECGELLPPLLPGP
jgi:hypothetical protein